MVKQVNFSSFMAPADTTSTEAKSAFDLDFKLVFILIQTICSCLAGVYNEYLLKRKGSDINIYVQNVFMYLDSIICNAAILLFQGQLVGAFTVASLQQVLHFKVLIIMVNNCAVGIVTSFFLKHMNSILKTFASALELVFTALFSYLLFGIPIYLNTALAITIVSAAVYLYSRNPVNNSALPLNRKHSVERKNLLDDDNDSDELEMEAPV